MKQLYIALFLLLPSIAYSQSPCPGLDSLNYGNQWYHTVQIGSQCWLKENLNIGKMILAVKDQTNNDTLEKFCYNNDSNMCNIYGGLYQWKEAVQYTRKQSPTGICPLGWHIPSSDEFDTLTKSVNGNSYALKEVDQGSGTNTSGFSGLLTGYNDYTLFGSLGNETDFWSSTIDFIPTQGGYPLNVDILSLELDSFIYRKANIYTGSNGLSVRCIRDTSPLLLQAPYGGENWKIGSHKKITWGGNNLTDTNVKLEYTIDNGQNWINIIESIPAVNSDYNWILPNTPSKNCKVRITDLRNSNSFSISNNVFTIDNSCLEGFTVEHGGKIYNTIAIGNQCWLRENLNIGTRIPTSQESSINRIIEKYCYNDDTANCTIYGGLYKYSETREEGLCPTFWHIEGLSTLIDQVINDANSLKSIGQGSGFGAGTNLSGFSALLTGYRGRDSAFHDLGNSTWFPYDSEPHLIFTDFIENTSTVGWTDHFGDMSAGSFRCVRNDIGPLLLRSPVGGENWLIGSTQKISWTLSNVVNIKIDYTTDNGTSWINIIPSLSASMGSYNWIIPNTPSKNSRVRISSINNSDTNFISNTFRIYKVSTDSCPGIPNINYAGQIYNTIAIGDQCWLKENLNIGTMINVSIDQSNNGTIEKYCYNNDTGNCSIYGGFYQWNEAMQYNTVENSKGICPDGWHIPSWGDFINLLTHVDNKENDLLEVGQGSGTNASGFSALLGGGGSQGNFNNLHNYAYYWNSTNYDESNACYSMLFSDNNINEGGAGNKIAGISIRCINDNKISNVPSKLEIVPPANFELSNAYPNPWNPTTTIRYQVPVNILVTIKIFDALGREVTTLVNEEKPAGSYEVTLNSKNLSSGVYYYQMRAGNFIETKKIILIK